MRVGELFAGIGGLSLGLERAGLDVRWQLECDDYATTILGRHWPGIPRRRDVRLADGSNLDRVDCIAGGFPCQDVSCAGKGAGVEAGRRSGLWREFARIVGELRPRWVLVENVPALRRRDSGSLPMQVANATSPITGPQAQASRSTTGSRRVLLNPAWVAALMGFPPGWLGDDDGTN